METSVLEDEDGFLVLLGLFSQSLGDVHDSLLFSEECVTFSHLLLERDHNLAVLASGR